MSNTSLPPNPTIANVMYLAGLIEHWGRGLSMMANECERVGLPAPAFIQDGTIVKITFARPQEYGRNTSGAQKDTAGHSKGTSKDTSKDTVGHSKNTAGHSKDTVGQNSIRNFTDINQLILKLIKAIGEDWYSANILCDIINLSSKSSFIRNYIRPAVNEGFVELEKPDNPNAPNQRYGLTVKGKAIFYSHKDTFAKGIPDPQNDLQNDPQNDPQNILEGHDDPLNTKRDPLNEIILAAIKRDGTISRAELAKAAGCSESTIKRRLKDMDIAWIGHPKTGHWAFVKPI